MGDIMLLSEQEVKTCIEFAFSSLLKKNSIQIKESSLSIDHKIKIQAIVLYQDYTIDLNASFLLNYQNNQLCFTHIQGKIEYLFLQFNLMNILKQMLVHEDIKIEDNDCYIGYILPIDTIEIKKHCLDIQLK